MQRRRFIHAASAAILGAGGSAARPAGDGIRRIPVIVSRFRFSASEIRAHAGETIALVLTSTDFMHGFALPELNARIDVPPGHSVELTLRPIRAGRFTYLCDNFCGEGHDRMAGVLVVAIAAKPG